MHTPVLLDEVLEGLDVKKGGRYIDATYGEGRHTREIVKRGGEVLAIDFDEEVTRNPTSPDSIRIRGAGKSLRLVHGNFKDIETIANKSKFCPVDGILFDLGLSMEQIARSKRGFSFKALDDPLDMRISKNQTQTAAEIINSSAARELYEIFSANSEEVDSWPIAKAIFRASRVKKIKTVGQLVDVVKSINKSESSLRRIFQALRIKANDEFANLKKGLKEAVKIIKPEGKILVITFHSLEDRIVKNFVRENKLKFENKKPIIGTGERSFEKSAKLRIIIA